MSCVTKLFCSNSGKCSFQIMTACSHCFFLFAVYAMCLFCVLLLICQCVQDTAILNVVNLTAVKIVAPVKRLQTRTQVKVNKFSQKSFLLLTCNVK